MQHEGCGVEAASSLASEETGSPPHRGDSPVHGGDSISSECFLPADNPDNCSDHSGLSESTSIISAACMYDLDGSDDEADGFRKVAIDPTYDFYSPVRKQKEVKYMPRDVLHRRVSWYSTGTGSRKVSPCGSAVGSPGGSSPEEPSSGRPSVSSVTSRASNMLLQRSVSKFNEDNVTNWGVLVAKVLRSRVMGFTGLVDKLISMRKKVENKAVPVNTLILTSVRIRAQMVLDKARKFCQGIRKESLDWQDHEWHDDGILEDLFDTEFGDTLIILAKGARKVLASQPTVAETVAPCRIFGDIHGQLRDVFHFFGAFGFPGEEGGPNIVFNGDFVDRGSHQLEVIGLLLALKIALPQQVWLVRGNHEDRSMNERYGFRDECTRHLGLDLGRKVYEAIHTVFDELPLACVISDQVLVVHGGIGDGKWDIDDLRAIPKPIKGDVIISNPIICNVLWSDPIEDDDTLQEGTFGVHASPRTGINSVRFGWDVTKTFCARNGISLVVRSHQSKQDSLGLDVMHERLLMRVFSARDYEGHGNDAAVLLISAAGEGGPLQARLQVLSSVEKMRAEVTKNARMPRGGSPHKRNDRRPSLGQILEAPGERIRTRRPSLASNSSSNSANSNVTLLSFQLPR